MKCVKCIILYVNTCEGQVVRPCAMGLKQSLMGMMEECLEGGWSFHILIGTAIIYVHFLTVNVYQVLSS